MSENQAPIGLVVAQTAKVIVRQFDERLTSAGGSLPSWLILQCLMIEGWMMQSELADGVGLQGPTLTHHLNAMEGAKLLTRVRLSTDRRSHKVEISPLGIGKYNALKVQASLFDVKLREVFSEGELKLLRSLLNKLAHAAQP
jgi:MarR family transcriptional regulator, transcriptional regulator for hemolysin